MKHTHWTIIAVDVIIVTVLVTWVVLSLGASVVEHWNQADQAFVLSVRNREFIDGLTQWLETQGITVILDGHTWDEMPQRSADCADTASTN